MKPPTYIYMGLGIGAIGVGAYLWYKKTHPPAFRLYYTGNGSLPHLITVHNVESVDVDSAGRLNLHGPLMTYEDVILDAPAKYPSNDKFTDMGSIKNIGLYFRYDAIRMNSIWFPGRYVCIPTDLKPTSTVYYRANLL